MTITQSPSAPLVAVVGGTGNQGGSVIKALAESDKLYRVRTFTREASKPAAQELAKLGIEIVVISLVVENKDAVYKAFAGADVAFLVTNSLEHLDGAREAAEGKLLVDAAKAAGVTRIVWSGLDSITNLSAGKYVNVFHFDSKAAVTEYGRASGIPFAEVQAGAYGKDILGSPLFLAKHEDGSYLMALPVKPTMLVSHIDVEEDYGLFVRRVIEAPVFPDGSSVLAHSEKIPIEDIAKQLSEISGKKIVFKQVPMEEFKGKLQAIGLPPHFVLAVAEVFQMLDEHGRNAPLSLDGLARRPRTWAEFVKSTDLSKAFA